MIAIMQYDGYMVNDVSKNQLQSWLEDKSLEGRCQHVTWPMFIRSDLES